jgi:membrane-associated protease RseP (regulator of RpoE activity)
MGNKVPSKSKALEKQEIEHLTRELEYVVVGFCTNLHNLYCNREVAKQLRDVSKAPLPKPATSDVAKVKREISKSLSKIREEFQAGAALSPRSSSSGSNPTPRPEQQSVSSHSSGQVKAGEAQTASATHKRFLEIAAQEVCNGQTDEQLKPSPSGPVTHEAFIKSGVRESVDARTVRQQQFSTPMVENHVGQNTNTGAGTCTAFLSKAFNMDAHPPQGLSETWAFLPWTLFSADSTDTSDESVPSQEPLSTLRISPFDRPLQIPVPSAKVFSASGSSLSGAAPAINNRKIPSVVKNEAVDPVIQLYLNKDRDFNGAKHVAFKADAINCVSPVSVYGADSPILLAQGSSSTGQTTVSVPLDYPQDLPLCAVGPAGEALDRNEMKEEFAGDSVSSLGHGRVQVSPVTKESERNYGAAVDSDRPIPAALNSYRGSVKELQFEVPLAGGLEVQLVGVNGNADEMSYLIVNKLTFRKDGQVGTMEKAGVKIGDVITAVNGKESSNSNDLAAVIKREPKVLHLKILRTDDLQWLKEMPAATRADQNPSVRSLAGTDRPVMATASTSQGKSLSTTLPEEMSLILAAVPSYELLEVTMKLPPNAGLGLKLCPFEATEGGMSRLYVVGYSGNSEGSLLSNPGYQAGIVSGDFIEAVNGAKFSSCKAMIEYIKSCRSSLKLGLRRKAAAADPDRKNDAPTVSSPNTDDVRISDLTSYHGNTVSSMWAKYPCSTGRRLHVTVSLPSHASHLGLGMQLQNIKAGANPIDGVIYRARVARFSTMVGSDNLPVENPSQAAGICVGDIIEGVNDVTAPSKEEFAKLIKAGGNPVKLSIFRP